MIVRFPTGKDTILAESPVIGEDPGKIQRMEECSVRVWSVNVYPSSVSVYLIPSVEVGASEFGLSQAMAPTVINNPRITLKCRAMPEELPMSD